MLSYQTVRRNDLQSPASSPRSSPDSAFNERLRSCVRNQFTLIPSDAVEVEGAGHVGNHVAYDDAESEAELVLFAAPTSSVPQAHKIRLQSPDAGTAQPGFIVKRPRSYYFAHEGDHEKKEEFQAAAIDAATIMSMATGPWPGCAVPWKVTKISGTGIQKSVRVGHPSLLMTVEDRVRKRKRKGKKNRIALRKQSRAKAAKKVEDERLMKEKEEVDREKKTRRNREKKVKKKARERAKKLVE